MSEVRAEAVEAGGGTIAARALRAASRLDPAELVCALLCVVAISVGPADALALVAAAVVGGGIERMIPYRRHRVFAEGWRADVFHAILSTAFATGLTGIAVVGGAALLHPLTEPVHNALAGQPLAARIIETLVIADFCTYFMHRAQHRWSLLWRFHQVHHSIERLDWLAAWRDHPVDKALIGFAAGLPLYALNLWDWRTAIVIIGIFETANTPWAHGNFRISLGPLWWVVRNPEFHRWHHSTERVAMNKNFAQTFPLFDIVFGTAYLPRDRDPEAFGLPYPMSTNYVDQLLVPFQPVPESPQAR